MNVYLSKKTLKITELKGNFTFLIPFDDTITYEFTASIWGSTGGWIPNSNFYKGKNACSSLKFILGNAWNSVIKDFNIPTSKCPIPAGTYITSGMDIKKLIDGNFSKLGYYGRFKAEAKARNSENKVLSCIIAELDLIRPWEKPID
ncbi:uncharacterized protein LOC100570461 [Acyrthosiphon pisum]|uniref:Uncharacterized protein n=1 Tax=Acyrthosiphon pisum TaxID=7029 RepID=A0A8R2F9H1_ACYPI|nr:uncharacterized protein LOC100570461 [Acyrthosiphon pisum]|eukprot:XP_008184871.1 PREDICTED: uncharacterized protein LOC100570461 [Acyrthosiphon pisum]